MTKRTHPDAPLPPARPRVVMADDHVLLLEALVGVLQPEFDVVATASDGMALLEAVTSHAPDVVVLDVGMPKLDGMAAATQLRASAPDTRLIFLTMHTDSAMAAQALRMGASAYVLKSAAAGEPGAVCRLESAANSPSPGHATPEHSPGLGTRVHQHVAPLP